MGVLRTVGKSLGRFLFTTGVTLAIVSVVLVNLTEYDTLQPIFSEILGTSVGDVDPATMDATLDILRQQCEGEESVEIPMPDGSTTTLDCSKVNEVGIDAEEVIATVMFDELYYKEYDCGFIECLFSGEMMVIMSAQGNTYLRNIQIIFIFVAAVGAAMILLLEETWPGRLKTIGVQMIIIGIPYFLMDILIPILLPNFVPTTEAGVVSQVMTLVDSIIEPMKMYFLYFLIAGIILTAAGYTWSYMKKKKEGVKPVKPKKK